MAPFRKTFLLLKGAGDLGTGVAWRLHRVVFPVIVTELAQPRVFRCTESLDHARQLLTAVNSQRLAVTADR